MCLCALHSSPPNWSPWWHSGGKHSHPSFCCASSLCCKTTTEYSSWSGCPVSWYSESLLYKLSLPTTPLKVLPQIWKTLFLVLFCNSKSCCCFYIKFSKYLFVSSHCISRLAILFFSVTKSSSLFLFSSWSPCISPSSSYTLSSLSITCLVNSSTSFCL